MSYDIFRGKQNDASALREMAARSRQAARDSFDRCDTDGFLSQWASDITAQQLERQAHIAEAGGRAQFTGLYQGKRRVAAKMVSSQFMGRTRSSWLLRDDEAARFGRKWVPVGLRSRVQGKLGLTERQEWAPAVAYLGGNGRGLAGCASAFVAAKRTGDEWGLDSEEATA